MDKKIEKIIEGKSNLKLKLNKGERHRIIHNNVKRGSLWFTPRVNGYSVCPTGEVESLLYHFLTQRFGKETGIDQTRKYWNIGSIQDVASIVEEFSK